MDDVLRNPMDNKKRSGDRLKVCRRCEYSGRLLRAVTCGTPIVGSTVMHEGVEINLCGCVMRFKSKLDCAKCPANKWKE
jgi:hypothetical protein